MSRRYPRAEIICVVLTYALCAALWIFFSDRLLSWLIDEPNKIAFISIVKGWLFVIVTSLLLFQLMHRLMDPKAIAENTDKNHFGTGLHWTLLIVAVLLLGFAYSQYRSFDNQQLQLSRIQSAATHDTAWLGLFVLMTIFTVGVVFYLFRQRQRLAESQTIQRAQAERLKALGLLAAIADSSNDAIFAKDLEGRYTLFNPASERFTGKKAVDVLGLDDTVLFSPEQAEMLIANDRAVLEEGRTVTYHEELDVSNGKRTFLATKGPLFDNDNNVIGIFGISRDISELKQAEQSLRDSEERFRALVEQSLAGIYIIQDYRFLYINPAFASILGYDSTRYIIETMTVGDLISPEYREEVMVNIARLVGGSVSSISNYRFTALRRDGSPAYIEAHGSAFDYQGRPAVIGLFLDISARKAAEDALRESERRFYDIANVSADWIWETDVYGRLTYSSGGVLEMLGYTSEEVLGKTPFDFMPSDEADKLREWFVDIRAHRKSFRNIENICRKKDGHLRYILSHGTPIFDDNGRLLGFRGLDQDITERKQAELAVRQSEAFKRAILDSVNAHIAVLDKLGIVVAVNQPWRRFAKDNGLASGEAFNSVDVGVNYLEVCQRSIGPSSEGAMTARDGILAVLEGRVPVFYLEYACHSPEQQRWFMMTATPLETDEHGVVIAHTDITARKAVEETLRRQTEELEDRNQELERFNRATVGRELDMIALKQKINQLSQQLGQSPPYPLAFLDNSQQET
ncbi:PAS domain-containing protein [Methylotuvimicrobium sp. KM1]|uniref:PAS domain-containing protein n=1 Tax=Methylotuvimicrobium sp. KM1 TaxID=3377707 RepID=UPI00384F3DCE